MKIDEVSERKRTPECPTSALDPPSTQHPDRAARSRSCGLPYGRRAPCLGRASTALGGQRSHIKEVSPGVRHPHRPRCFLAARDPPRLQNPLPPRRCPRPSGAPGKRQLPTTRCRSPPRHLMTLYLPNKTWKARGQADAEGGSPEPASQPPVAARQSPSTAPPTAHRRVLAHSLPTEAQLPSAAANCTPRVRLQDGAQGRRHQEALGPTAVAQRCCARLS